MDYSGISSAEARSKNAVERNMELVALYNATLKLMIDRGVKSPRKAALRFVIHNGRPRYNVSFKTAYEAVCQILRHGTMPRAASVLRREMYCEIAYRAAMLCDSGMSVAAAVEFVLEHCRASRFYISEESADTIIDEARREYRRRKYRTQ